MEFLFDEVWERISLELGWNKLGDLSRFLEFSPASVSGARKRGNFPIEWAFRIAQGHGLSTDWILTGEGQKRRGGADSGTGEIKENPPEYSNGAVLVITEPESHLQHDEEFIQSLASKHLENFKPEELVEFSRKDLELVFIFNQIKDHKDIYSDLENTAIECLVTYWNERGLSASEE